MKCEELNPPLIWHILTNIYGGSQKKKTSPKSIATRIKGWILKQNSTNSINLRIMEDEVGNIFIRKPASPGWEQCQPILLQAHYDINIDFEENQKGSICSTLNLDSEQEWFEIIGSPIMDDSVVGVALILAVLTDRTGEIRHGPLEALFTVKKGSQFIGALNLNPTKFAIESQLLLNFDAVDLGSIINGTAGCAEFILSKSISYLTEIDPTAYEFFQLTLSGLKGGDLGSEIQFLRANALKIAARCLSAIESHSPIFLGNWEGGHYYRFIPQDCEVKFAVPKEKAVKIQEVFQKERGYILKKYHFYSEYGQNLEPNLQILLERTESFPFIDDLNSVKIITLAEWIPQGLIEKSALEYESGKTTNNFAKIVMNLDQIQFFCKTRGDSSAELKAFNRKLKLLCHFGWEVTNEYNFPVWESSVPGQFLQYVKHIYEDVINYPVRVTRSFWVLEPGAIQSKFPSMESVSIGPTEIGVYPANYKVKVSDIQILYDVLKQILFQMRKFELKPKENRK